METIQIIWLFFISTISILVWFRHSKYACYWLGHESGKGGVWYQSGYAGTEDPSSLLGSVKHSYCPQCSKEVRAVTRKNRLIGYFDEAGCKKYNYEWVNKEEWKLKKLLTGHREDPTVRVAPRGPQGYKGP